MSRTIRRMDKSHISSHHIHYIYLQRRFFENFAGIQISWAQHSKAKKFVKGGFSIKPFWWCRLFTFFNSCNIHFQWQNNLFVTCFYSKGFLLFLYIYLHILDKFGILLLGSTLLKWNVAMGDGFCLLVLFSWPGPPHALPTFPLLFDLLKPWKGFWTSRKKPW